MSYFQWRLGLRNSSWVAILAVSVVACAAEKRSTADEANDAGIQFAQHYCISCHEGVDADASLDLTRFDSAETIGTDRQLWRKVLRRVRDHVMPPEDGEAPEASERAAFIRWIENSLLNRAPRRQLAGTGHRKTAEPNRVWHDDS